MARKFAWAAGVGVVLSIMAIVRRASTPKEAVGFFGTVTGVVKTAQPNGTSFVITVSKAVADEAHSAIKETGPMVGKELTLGTRMPRDKEGKPHPHEEDVAYIKTLKPGDAISVLIFAVRADPTVLRMQKPGQTAGK